MEQKVDSKAFFKIGYGLYLVTVNDGYKDNGLIVNSVMQVTSTPNRVAVTVNKQNYSHDGIRSSGILNVGCLTTDTPFSVFENFGFQTGRRADKFAGYAEERSENGLRIVPQYCNAYLSLSVEQYLEFETHGMFICTVSEARVLSDRESMTYAYYHQNVKPKKQDAPKKGYVCTVCGYVYEGDTLPDDFICPLCKHPASDFVKL